MNMMKHRIETVVDQIDRFAQSGARSPSEIELIAVSKTRSGAEIRQAWESGLTRFGESYLQEAIEKQKALTDLPIEWHFIGPIQSNKTKPIAEHFAWVHSVDRLRIAQRLSNQRPETLPPLQICLQVNIDGEESKSGIEPDAVEELAHQIAALPRLTLRGLMAIPAPTDSLEAQRIPFQKLRQLFDRLNQQGFTLDTLSMGMSDDLEAAILEGSTQVRIGTALFGVRDSAK
jgi:pyridoxal phosphate enzyme (YggS family)